MSSSGSMEAEAGNTTGQTLQVPKPAQLVATQQEDDKLCKLSC